MLFRWGLGCLAVGLAMLALPASLEGPVLVEISPGHAVAAADAVGILPLAIGSALVFWALWFRRFQLSIWVSSRPATALGAVFISGLGLGLLLASSFSSFFWWWAIGAALFAATVVAASVVAARV